MDYRAQQATVRVSIPDGSKSFFSVLQSVQNVSGPQPAPPNAVGKSGSFSGVKLPGVCR